ncbi:MAG: HigA family addiction module antidote protein [Lachnospiraceae bacterium]|nr:HigA family addiction module antidote protein [Lachnospiraceae bacterium]
MATKITGISRDLIIHPGETIADILVERGITQAELAARTGVTPAYVCNVIAGKKDISGKFAFALEYALGVSKSFWINLQANYDAELLEFNAPETITDEERIARSSLKDVVKYLRDSGKMPIREAVDDSILSLRKVLQISNIANLKEIVPEGALRMSAKSKINPYVMGAWVRLCQIAGERRNVKTEFDVKRIDELVVKAKAVMCSAGESVQKSLTELFSEYGIDFSVMWNFRGAPVQGYISKKNDGTYQMVLTIRGAYADIFWFSLFHELGHIVNGDVTGTINFIDYNEIAEVEIGANDFASTRLIKPDAYEHFVEKGDYSLDAIKTFAVSQGIRPYIVIGRLQREKMLDYNRYSSEKVRYKWA